MSDDLHLDKVVKGYAVLASELLKKWSPYVAGVSTKVTSGNYATADAETDFAAGAKLVAESIFAVGSEAFDAVSVMTSDFNEVVAAGGYDTDKGLNEVRTLTVKDDLKSVSGQTLPKDRVTFEPPVLQPQITHFETKVNGDGIKARTYDGVVLSTSAAGVVVDEVKVSVTVG